MYERPVFEAHMDPSEAALSPHPLRTEIRGERVFAGQKRKKICSEFVIYAQLICKNRPSSSVPSPTYTARQWGTFNSELIFRVFLRASISAAVALEKINF